ncbi:MAG TPA: hypothetical protein VKE98_15125, partial [Gemmataceae bacterium]|nr:hypothetical protein [Gemmataceae bacterium]
GVVRACPEISAKDFAAQVAGSGFAELADFGIREACFVLSKVAMIEPGKAVGTEFAERVGVASRHWELSILRVMVK